MSLETAITAIRQKMATAYDIHGVIKLDFGPEGDVVIDARQKPPVITSDTLVPDVELVTDLKTFEDLLSGSQNPNIAFMMGKIKIKGSMGLAMKLNAILED